MIGNSGEFHVCQGVVFAGTCIDRGSMQSALEGMPMPADTVDLRTHIRGTRGNGFKIVDIDITSDKLLFVYLKLKGK